MFLDNAEYEERKTKCDTVSGSMLHWHDKLLIHWDVFLILYI